MRTLTIVAIALVIIIGTSVACAHTRPPIAAAPTNDLARPAATPQDALAPNATADERIRAANQRVAKIQGDLDEAKAIAKQEREAKAQEHRDGIKRVVDWACGIAALLGIVGAGVAVVLRSKFLALVPVAAVVMIAVGQTTNIVVDHPWFTALGIGALAALIGGVPALRHRAQRLAEGARAVAGVAATVMPTAA